MHNPLTPASSSRACTWSPTNISGRELAEKLDVALRLSKVIGRNPESWRVMQDNHDLWQAKQSMDLGRVQKLKWAVA